MIGPYDGPNGSQIHLVTQTWKDDKSRGGSGELKALTIVLSSDKEDARSYYNAILELSSQDARHRAAQSIASRLAQGDNYHDLVGTWDSTFLDIWSQISYERQAEAPPVTLVRLSDYSKPILPPDFWQGLMTANTISMIYGDSGQGKSTIVNGLAVSAAEGIPFLGRSVKQGNVILIDYELNQTYTGYRFHQISEGFGSFKLSPNVYYLPMDIRRPLAGFMAELKAMIEEKDPVLIIIDSLGSATAGDQMESEAIIQLLGGPLKDLPVSILIVDHQSKAQIGRAYSATTAFGSVYKTHLSRSILQVQQIANVDGKASIVIRHQKTNFGPKAPDIVVHLRYERGMIFFDMGNIDDPEFESINPAGLSPRMKDLLLKSDMALSYESMAASLNVKVGSVKNAMAALKEITDVIESKADDKKTKLFTVSKGDIPNEG